MNHTNDIQDIIHQLTRISIDTDRLHRQEEISQLTPIQKVHEMGSISDLESTIPGSKVVPANAKTTIADIHNFNNNNNACGVYK